MFNLFKKQQKGMQFCFKVEGMNCTSCAMNIDGELEELEGIYEANTNYAKAETTIQYDPNQVDQEKLKKVIEKLGYSIKE